MISKVLKIEDFLLGQSFLCQVWLPLSLRGAIMKMLSFLGSIRYQRNTSNVEVDYPQEEDDLRNLIWKYSLCFRLASFRFIIQFVVFLEKCPDDSRIDLPQTEEPKGRCGLRQGLVFTRQISGEKIR